MIAVHGYKKWEMCNNERAREREELKLEVLRTIATSLKFNLHQIFPSDKALYKLLPERDHNALLEALWDLINGGYLSAESHMHEGVKFPYDIRLTIAGRDRAENHYKSANPAD
jgi:hypothetical protein